MRIIRKNKTMNKEIQSKIHDLLNAKGYILIDVFDGIHRYRLDNEDIEIKFITHTDGL
jgi:hypothetical protein